MLPARAEPQARVAARPRGSRRRLLLGLGAALLLASCTTVTRTAVRAGNGEAGGAVGDTSAGSADAGGTGAGGGGGQGGAGAGASGAAGGSAAAAARRTGGGA